ncbi:MAG: RdgB/HAM1 family non-canonical purine NTP pyrophosphatase [Acidimicrobiia bacterium]|nr:RdgB/HAM1 family non-canonical purine NTP pyrophosphatase [Acidimicrobiia bacterium]
MTSADRRFVLATANPDKVREIVGILAASLPDFEFLERPDDVPEVAETGDTLAENARLKAAALAAATGLPAVADDTGLIVDALGGAPGVRSARYAGEDATYADNTAYLLRELAAREENQEAHEKQGMGPDLRGATFATVVVVRWPDGREVAATGEVAGRITLEPRGAGGFGYDAVFVPEEGDGRTFAEMSAEEKNAMSHRGRALRSLVEGLRVAKVAENADGDRS